MSKRWGSKPKNPDTSTRQFEADRRRNDREMNEAEQRAQREHLARIEREAEKNRRDSR